MANSDLRLFNFFDQYIWQAQDFTNLQKWIWDFAAAVGEGLAGPSVLTGLTVQSAGGLLMQVNAGMGFSTAGGPDAQGQICLLQTASQVAIPVNGVNPSRSLIVLRPTQTGTTFIPQPLSPIVNVPLHIALGCTVVVIPGTPSGVPVYPAALPGDIVVAGVLVPAGAVTLTASNLERAPISTPRQKMQGITVVTNNYVAASGDLGEDIIEADASSVAASGIMITLPPASVYAGRKKTIINVGASNPVSASGNGAETISGQAIQVLDDQWSSMTVYSNGLGWRIA